MRRYLLLAAALFFTKTVFSQNSITGTQCVSPGVSYLYSFSGTWHTPSPPSDPGTTMYWTIVGGVITGTSNTAVSGTPKVQIYVTWNSGVTTGSVSVYTSNPASGTVNLPITITSSVAGGTISNSSQTIAYNATPATLTCSAASGGGCSPSYSYQWQSTTDPGVVAWSDISGATSQNLSFSSVLTTTMYYRRKVTESVSATTDYSNTATVNVNLPAIVAGNSYPTYQLTNNSNGNPLTIVTTPASLVTCGDGSCLHYQWQYSTDHSTWYDMTGDTLPNFMAGAGNPASETFYRVKITASGATTAYTTVDTIATQSSVLSGPTECYVGQLGNYFYTQDPGNIPSFNWTVGYGDSIASPYTGVGEFDVKWKTTGTKYIYLDYGTHHYNLTVHVTIWPLYPGYIGAGKINVESGSSQTINCDAPTGGSGNYSYQWQLSTDSTTYTNISGQTGSWLTDYVVTQSGYIRRKVSSGSGYAYSDTVLVNAFARLTPGVIATVDTDSIPWNSVPSLLTETTAPSGGDGSKYQYTWQYGDPWFGFVDVPSGGQGTTYQPAALIGNLYYRRAVTCNGIVRYSDTILLKSKMVQFSPGSISPAIFVVSSGTSTSFTGTSATGGTSATYSYQWQKSYDEVNWSNCSGATSTSYSPGAQTRTAYYRRLVTNGAQSGYANVAAVYNEITVRVKPGLGSTVIPTAGVSTTADGSVTNAAVNPYTYSGISNAKVNYVRTWDVSKQSVTTLSAAKALTSVTDAQQVTAYFDDLGRPIQTVAEDATPEQKDLITVENYDILGRQVQQYLPYTDSTTTGDFKTNPSTKQPAFYDKLYNNTEGYYYANTTYENSPLKRVLKQTAPGNSWTGSDVGVRTDYTFNTSLDSVVNWTIGTTSTATPSASGYYNPGMLALIITTDEHENKTMEYKDKDGKVILKKVQVSDTLFNGHHGWACTYYVYDVLNRLRYVLSPNATDYAYNNSTQWALNPTVRSELCFQYVYDSLARMVSKVVPGAGITYMVYDKRNRPVFTQDSSLRASNQWLGTLYDDEDRLIETGMLSYSSGVTALQNYVNSHSGSSSYSSSAISGNTAPAILPDLYVTTRVTGQTLYQAGNTITFDGSFTSEDGANFSTLLNATAQDNFNDTMSVLDNPVPSGYTFTPLTITNYDDYSKTAKSYTTANNSIVDNGSNSYAYALPSQVNPMTIGMVTNTKVRILQSATDITQGAWEETTNFYDDKGRVVQTQTTNSSGAKDTLITQYTFAGLPLNSLSCEVKAGANLQSYRVLTRVNYDATWRLSSVTKQIGNSYPTTVESNTYNQLGQLVTKRQGQQRNTNFTYASAAIDTLDYTYNIRGWLSGINRGYANPLYTSEASTQSGRWFGMELAYDFGFTNKQLNGNIGGIIWRNTSDGEQRAYGFAYDNLNRLTRADFTQNNSGWNLNAGVDYSVHSISYDLNGNILTMNQMGLKLNSSNLIDSLVYGYNTTSNKLNYVTDKNNDTTTHLGDFTEINKNTSQDYWYDGNGNLVQDNNKKISSIHYNYLNLPDSIRMTGKGTIRYVYDAAGAKLQKIVNDSLLNKQTVTSYVGSAVYQFSQPVSSSSEGTDSLQYIMQEEGRIREKSVGKTDTMYYDYFVKDHLGNTRAVLTDELQTDAYPDASLEDASIANERLYYSGVDTGRVNKNTVSGYPTDNYTSPNDYIQKLNGSGPKIGTGILLKVMAGDSITVRANSWWNSNASPGTPVSPVTDIVNALLGSIPAASANKAVQSQISSTILSPDVSSFLTSRDSGLNGSLPKAWLNIVLLDEHLNPVVNTGSGRDSYFDQVGTSNTFKTHSTSRRVTKSGYVYIYVSNETPNIDVFFDNLQVTHKRGPLLETDNYMPFGLVQAGISSKAAGSLETKNKFNHQLLDDDLQLNWYQFKFRNYDPQIGRFTEIDPLCDSFQYNSTFAYAENKLGKGFDLEGLELEEFNKMFNYSGINVDQANRTTQAIASNVAEKLQPAITVTKDIITVTGGVTLMIVSGGSATPFLVALAGSATITGGTIKLAFDITGNSAAASRIPTSAVGTVMFTANSLSQSVGGGELFNENVQTAAEVTEEVLTFKVTGFDKMDNLEKVGTALTGITITLDVTSPETAKAFQQLFNFSGSGKPYSLFQPTQKDQTNVKPVMIPPTSKKNNNSQNENEQYINDSDEWYMDRQ